MIGAVGGGLIGVLFIANGGPLPDKGLAVVFILSCMCIGIFGEAIADIWFAGE